MTVLVTYWPTGYEVVHHIKHIKFSDDDGVYDLGAEQLKVHWRIGANFFTFA